MGNIGVPEMLFIFVLALLIFGPKKLPELGRSIGKALNEFKRASAELKGSLEREMDNLEQDVKSVESKKQAPPATTTVENHQPAENAVPAETPAPGDPAKTTEDHGYQDYSYTEHRD